MLAALLAALQTFFNYGDLSSKHRAAAADYGASKRLIDEILAAHAEGDSLKQEHIENIRRQMDNLSKNTPEVPDRIWVSARKKVPPGSTGVLDVEDV